MEVVKAVERLGSGSGKPAAQVRIADCGVTSPPARAAAAPPSPSPSAVAAGSKRPAEVGAANAGKKANTEVKSPSAVEGIENPEKNQKKIQLASGLEYVDIKVSSVCLTCMQPVCNLSSRLALLLTLPFKVGTGQVASGGKKIVVGYKGVLKVRFYSPVHCCPRRRRLALFAGRFLLTPHAAERLQRI
jgi:hypothetical protein